MHVGDRPGRDPHGDLPNPSKRCRSDAHRVESLCKLQLLLGKVSEIRHGSHKCIVRSRPAYRLVRQLTAAAKV